MISIFFVVDGRGAFWFCIHKSIMKSILVQKISSDSRKGFNFSIIFAVVKSLVVDLVLHNTVSIWLMICKTFVPLN